MTKEEYKKKQKEIIMIMLLTDKVEELICSFKPMDNAPDFDCATDLLGLQNYLLKGQGRLKRVRKNLMDRLITIGDDPGDAADFVSQKIDEIFDKHITLK